MSNEQYIKRCLELAEKSKGFVSPNPMVGAVLVYNNRIIGEGRHEQYGQAHAEVNCIESVAPKDRHLVSESTMYVSLEPCAHYGNTPPCALRIIEEEIKHVVICNNDPFEKVSGRGIKLLVDKGIKVEQGILEKQGKWLNRRFFHFHQQKRPYIILKWAQTVNGFFAPADHSRMQLTNIHAAQLVHKWRTEESAIMVGYNTALNDDPQLTARLYTGKQPLRIVLDKQLKLSPSQKILDDQAPTWIINEQKEEAINNLRYIKIPFNDNLLQNLFAELYATNVQSVIIEGGTRLLKSVIEKDLWDEARVFTAAVTLENGLTAPLLTNANHMLTVDIINDKLEVYTHRHNPFAYVEGMNL